MPRLVIGEEQVSVDKAYDELRAWSKQPQRVLMAPGSSSSAEKTTNLSEMLEDDTQSELFRLAMLEQSQLKAEVRTTGLCIPPSVDQDKENDTKSRSSPKKHKAGSSHRAKPIRVGGTLPLSSPSPPKLQKESLRTNNETQLLPTVGLMSQPGTSVVPFHDCIYRDPGVSLAPKKLPTTNSVSIHDGKQRRLTVGPLSPSKCANQATTALTLGVKPPRSATERKPEATQSPKASKTTDFHEPGSLAPPGRPTTQFDRLHSCLFDSVDKNRGGVISRQEWDQAASTKEITTETTEATELPKEPYSLDQLYKTVSPMHGDPLVPHPHCTLLLLR